jgi:hypothetical protein
MCQVESKPGQLARFSQLLTKPGRICPLHFSPRQRQAVKLIFTTEPSLVEFSLLLNLGNILVSKKLYLSLFAQTRLNQGDEKSSG